MNQSQSRTIRYAVAGLCGLALLMIFGWLVLRETPPSSEPPPVRAVTVTPRARSVDLLFTSDDEAPRETPTNQVAGSETANTNAAAIYWQAFAIFDTLSQTQKDLVANWRTNVDASVEAELCEKIQPICDLMHQAAAVSNCDWGLEQPITFETRLPHLSRCRNLARAAVWSVAHCRTNDPSAAIDDLAATSQLGQTVLSPPILIGHLVDLVIQGLVIDSVTEHAGLLVSAGGTSVGELLNNANYDESLRGAFELEADMINRETDRLTTIPPEEAMHELLQLAEEAKSQIQSMGLTQAIADMRQAAELQRQYAQALGLPDAEYRAWLTSLDEAGKTNPFVEVFVTGLEKAVIRTQAMTVRTAMAAAGLAVMQDGPAALQSHPDPSTGQPFAYTQTGDGFELQSSFQVAEKPVKLSFK
jgi:hypothetical protein